MAEMQPTTSAKVYKTPGYAAKRDKTIARAKAHYLANREKILADAKAKRDLKPKKPKMTPG